MGLRQAYEVIIKDILVSRELGFDVEITNELANKITKVLTNTDDFLLQVEESLSDLIGEEVENLADEFELYED